MNSHNHQNLQKCPVCGVSIGEDGQVNFFNGQSGTRARLYARVCQYTQKPECINKNTENIGEITPQDYFESGQNLPMPVVFSGTTED